MSGFKRAITKTYDFDGDAVTVTFNSLRRAQAMELSSYVKLGEDGEMVLSFKENLELLEKVSELFPVCIQRLSGLFIEGIEVDYVRDGQVSNPEGWDDFLNNIYFMGLHQLIMADLMNASFLTEEEQKKSEELPAATSKESQA